VGEKGGVTSPSLRGIFSNELPAFEAAPPP